MSRVLDKIMSGNVESTLGTDVRDAAVRLVRACECIFDAQWILDRLIEQRSTVETKRLLYPVPPYSVTGVEMTLPGGLPVAVQMYAHASSVRCAIYFEADGRVIGPSVYFTYQLDSTGRISKMTHGQPPESEISEGTATALVKNVAPVVILLMTMANCQGVRIYTENFLPVGVSPHQLEKLRKKKGVSYLQRRIIDEASWKEWAATRGGLGMGMGQQALLANPPHIASDGSFLKLNLSGTHWMQRPQSVSLKLVQ